MEVWKPSKKKLGLSEKSL